MFEVVSTRKPCWLDSVITITPRQTVAEQDAEYGPKLHDRDPDLCCFLRKVKPLEEGLTRFDAWATGLRPRPRTAANAGISAKRMRPSTTATGIISPA